MLSVLWKIEDFIGFIWGAISSFVQIITRVFSLIGSVIAGFGRILSSLPTIVYIAVFVLIIVCVLYKVLGREGGSQA